jgi:hypothetical protein
LLTVPTDNLPPDEVRSLQGHRRGGLEIYRPAPTNSDAGVTDLQNAGDDAAREGLLLLVRMAGSSRIDLNRETVFIDTS